MEPRREYARSGQADGGGNRSARDGPPQRQDRWRIDGLVRELYGLTEEEIAIGEDAAR
jgi:hypothetical protein